MYDYHKPLYQKMDRMKFDALNRMDNRHSPEAYQLMRGFDDMRKGVARGEHARTLEARMRSMDMLVRNAQTRNSGLMSVQDSNRFRKGFQDTITRDIRKLPHY